MADIFIHVGFGKCGSSFLQQNIFPYMKDINYCKGNLFYSKILEEKPNVFSEEILSGLLVEPDPRTKGYVYPDDDGTCKYVYADRVKRLYPNSKIIIITREIAGLLRSSYRESVRQGLSLSFDEFKVKVFLERQVDLDVDRYISYMRKLFPDVYVSDFELLKNDIDGFVLGICNFIGCAFPDYKRKKVNESFNDVQLSVAVFFNKITKSNKNKNGVIPLTRFTKVGDIVSPFRRKF